MTAEIAILNKSAIVLAADSAVTIGQGNSAKIFNTANKIFEISDQSSIGLMIFNNLDFMGLPLEVLAKEFRRKHGAKAFATVDDCRHAFISFLDTEVESTPRDINRHFQMFAYDVLTTVSSRYDQALQVHIMQTRKVLVSKFNGVLKGVLQDAIKEYEALDNAVWYGNTRLNDNRKKLIDELFPTVFPNVQLTQQCKRLAHRLVALAICKNTASTNYTGLVFAGFGEAELCPTLVHIEIDGILDGRLKHIERAIVNIGRHGPEAEIIGFAQDDMVQSFVNGVDPQLRQYSQTLIREAIGRTASLILGPIIKDQRKLNTALRKLVPDLDDLANRLKEKRDEFTESNYTKDVKDMVRMMPKEEMANLAESLIDITSLKRKVTRDRETVGGEVDVAVISRSEGMVWVKRKHYFPAELNSRFFSRTGPK
ncbi:hypothetical protein [Ruegeria atlantica]|uniref:hypothetical protein n=1 Tax=Ruegeria atlantica TaxID=81569 RepID=UPI00147C80F2|nr:hypothetical protein [Ruegeria atlantica]